MSLLLGLSGMIGTLQDENDDSSAWFGLPVPSTPAWPQVALFSCSLIRSIRLKTRKERDSNHRHAMAIRVDMKTAVIKLVDQIYRNQQFFELVLGDDDREELVTIVSKARASSATYNCS